MRGFPDLPLVDDAPLLVLDESGTSVERRLVEQWLDGATHDHGAPVELVRGAGALADRLPDLTDDTLVTPVRVAWLPRERGGVRRARWSDVLQLTNPHRPSRGVQERIAAREPDRCAIVVAQPAEVSVLRSRWREHRGGDSADTGAFAGFVTRQATLALDRAERAVPGGGRYKVPRYIVEAIEGSAAFRREIVGLANRLELPEAEVTAKASEDLRGLVAAMSPLAIDLLSSALRPLHSRAWRVQVDVDGLEALRELNRRYPLVFLPCHRSYADPLVLADVLAEYDFPRNHVLGGDNLRFWPLAPLARRAGIVFIRRSFADDEIYKMVVREYFAYLLAKRFNLEWYMEGGRSRTGKLRPPRYGLLSYVAEAVEHDRIDDLYLVPVSIAYDQLREVAAMAAEQAGGTKRGEGLAWLASYARKQLTRVGNVQVRFAEPIALRAQLPPRGAAEPAARRLALQKVAFEVAVRINRVTPVLATALVTLALLGVRDRALTLGQVRQVLEPVLDYVEARKLPGSGLELLRRPAGVRGVLRALARENVVTEYSGGVEPVYAIERGQHLVAAFYRNSAIHHFVNRAIAELTLLRPGGPAWEEAERLRDLLKFEFFFPERETFRAELVDELRLIDPDWERRDGAELLARSGFLIAHRVLRSFLDAQLVIAEQLAGRDPRAPIVEKEFLAECAGVGQQMLLQGRLHGPESLSRELFASALKLATNRDLVDPGREELRERRAAFAAQLRDTVGRVTEIDEIDARRRREAAGVQP
jgi:glycerol-3-phosphate O-acyltransferase